MKALSLVTVLVISLCLTGCKNTELVNCQQEKDLLQSQLVQAKSEIEQKDEKIEELKAKNIEDSNKAMEAVTTMMTKQAEADKKLKGQLAEKSAQVKELEKKVKAMGVEYDNLKGNYENALQSLKANEKESQELIDKMNEAQKATAP